MTDLDTGVERYRRAGWDLSERTEHRAVMIDRSLGSPVVHGAVFAVTLVVALATGVYAVFLTGNVAYAYYKYVVDADRRILRAEEPADQAPPDPSPQDSASPRTRGSGGSVVDRLRQSVDDLLGRNERSGGRAPGGASGQGRPQSAGQRRQRTAGGQRQQRTAGGQGRPQGGGHRQRGSADGHGRQRTAGGHGRSQRGGQGQRGTGGGHGQHPNAGGQGEAPPPDTEQARPAEERDPRGDGTTDG